MLKPQFSNAEQIHKKHCEFILFFQQRTIASFESMNFSSQKDLVDERRAIIEEAFRIGYILSQLLRNECVTLIFVTFKMCYLNP